MSDHSSRLDLHLTTLSEIGVFASLALLLCHCMWHVAFSEGLSKNSPIMCVPRQGHLEIILMKRSIHVFTQGLTWLVTCSDVVHWQSSPETGLWPLESQLKAPTYKAMWRLTFKPTDVLDADRIHCQLQHCKKTPLDIVVLSSPWIVSSQICETQGTLSIHSDSVTKFKCMQLLDSSSWSNDYLQQNEDRTFIIHFCCLEASVHHIVCINSCIERTWKMSNHKPNYLV